MELLASWLVYIHSNIVYSIVYMYVYAFTGEYMKEGKSDSTFNSKGNKYWTEIHSTLVILKQHNKW